MKGVTEWDILSDSPSNFAPPKIIHFVRGGHGTGNFSGNTVLFYLDGGRNRPGGELENLFSQTLPVFHRIGWGGRSNGMGNYQRYEIEFRRNLLFQIPYVFGSVCVERGG